MHALLDCVGVGNFRLNSNQITHFSGCFWSHDNHTGNGSHICEIRLLTLGRERASYDGKAASLASDAILIRLVIGSVYPTVAMYNVGSKEKGEKMLSEM